MSNAGARPARIGSNVAVVAVFDDSSVRKVSIKQITSTSNTGGVPWSETSCSPNQTDSPESWKPVASAKPARP